MEDVMADVKRIYVEKKEPYAVSFSFCAYFLS